VDSGFGNLPDGQITEAMAGWFDVRFAAD